jgi:putative MATE family efflux protein
MTPLAWDTEMGSFLSKGSMRDRILESDIIRTALTLAWPVMLSNAFQTVYNLTDAFWLGKVGPEAVAAPSISFPIIFLLIALSAGFAIAGLSLVSQYVGAGEYEKANKAAGQLLTILIVASTIVAVVGFFLAEFILRLMNIPEGVIGVTSSYLKITFLGLPFMFFHFGFQALLRGYGDTRTPMILSVSTAVLDTILDPFFIFGWLGLPAMGAAGAALTTVMTRGIGGAIGMYLLFSGKVGIKIKLTDLKPDRQLMKRIVSIGLPSSIGQSGSALGFTVLTSLIAAEDKLLGGTGLLLSAYGIGNRISSLIQIVIMGGVSALTTMVGQNIGADQVDRAKEIVKKLFTTFIAISIVESILVYMLRVQIYQFFIDNQEVINLGSNYIAFFIPFIPFFTLFRLCTSVFQAAGKTKISMAISLIRLWGMRILLSYVFYFVLKMGVNGIWMGLALGNVGSAILSIAWLSRSKWHQKIIE